MIAAETLDAIAAAVRRNADPASLRAAFPGIAFSACSDDDIPARAKPVFDADDYLLYLIASPSGHCLTLTNDSECVSGVVIAAKEDNA